MPSAMSSNGPSSRVPAWKRLGLKLKFASESTSISTPPVSLPQTIESKRKRTVEGYKPTDLKRAKTSFKSEQKLQASTPPQSSTESDLRRRRSVTFTPETKTEDGESAKQLFKAWFAEQRAEDPSFDSRSLGIAFSTPARPEIAEDFDEKLDEPERRVKRVIAPAKDQRNKTTKKRKAQQIVKSKVKAKGGSLNAALAYLTAFRNSRSTWKFNKIHQRNILKNTFDLELIPSSYGELLYFYIAGLQGIARTQLRNSAFEIKVKDQEEGEAGFPITMANVAKLQEEYDAALAEYVASILAHEAAPEMGYQEGILMGLSDFAMRPRMEKRMRAERILAELGQQAANDDDLVGRRTSENDREERPTSQKQLPPSDGSEKRVRRKRKQRTAVVDLTSSSEDSSDSEDDSSTGGQRIEPITVSDDDSSSSGTNTSDSDDNGDESSEVSENAGSDEDDSDSDASEGIQRA